MSLPEMIYEKSRHLSDEKAQEVIDFIDFLLRRSAPPPASDKRLSVLTPEQREAYEYLNKIRIDWGGKPIANREEANARR